MENVMFGAQLRCDAFCVRALVVCFNVKPDGERGDSARGMACRNRGNEAGVDSSAEKNAERHIATETQADGGIEDVVQAVHGARKRSGERLRLARQVPVTTGLESGRIDGGDRPRLELGHGCINRVRSWDVAERQVAIDRQEVDVPPYRVGSAQAWQCRRKVETVVVRDAVVERLLADAVSRENQMSVTVIPESEREHAAQVMHAVDPLELIKA